MTTDPSSLSAANEDSEENISLTPEDNWLLTLLLSPPKSGSPQVTTDPSSFKAA